MGQAHARAGVRQGDGEKAELSTLDSVSVTSVRDSAVDEVGRDWSLPVPPRYLD